PGGHHNQQGKQNLTEAQDGGSVETRRRWGRAGAGLESMPGILTTGPRPGGSVGPGAQILIRSQNSAAAREAASDERPQCRACVRRPADQLGGAKNSSAMPSGSRK